MPLYRPEIMIEREIFEIKNVPPNDSVTVWGIRRSVMTNACFSLSELFKCDPVEKNPGNMF